jgi:hypothetical protein
VLDSLLHNVSQICFEWLFKVHVYKSVRETLGKIFEVLMVVKTLIVVL